jgi:hypothetical protein
VQIKLILPIKIRKFPGKSPGGEAIIIAIFAGLKFLS